MSRQLRKTCRRTTGRLDWEGVCGVALYWVLWCTRGEHRRPFGCPLVSQSWLGWLSAVGADGDSGHPLPCTIGVPVGRTDPFLHSQSVWKSLTRALGIPGVEVPQEAAQDLWLFVICALSLMSSHSSHSLSTYYIPGILSDGF